MDLYQELIIEHSKRPQRMGRPTPFDAEVHLVNPTRGDEITLRVDREGEVVTDISYDALGCAISVASASMLAEQLTGTDLDTARDTFAAIRTMLTSKGADPGDEDVIGDAVALAGVAQYPARGKCALLSWMALADALAKTGVNLAEETHV